MPFEQPRGHVALLGTEQQGVPLPAAQLRRAGIERAQRPSQVAGIEPNLCQVDQTEVQVTAGFLVALLL